MTHRPLTGPTRPDHVRRIIWETFPNTDRFWDFTNPTLPIDEWQRVTASDWDAVGRIFWYMTQNMLVRDAVPLYKALANIDLGTWGLGGLGEANVGAWVRGMGLHSLGLAVWAAINDDIKRKQKAQK